MIPEPVAFGKGGRVSRPVASPDAFSSEGSFIDWINHFDDDKPLWLQICLTVWAQTAYKQLKAEEGTYNNIVKTLCQRFEPDI